MDMAVGDSYDDDLVLRLGCPMESGISAGGVWRLPWRENLAVSNNVLPETPAHLTLAQYNTARRQQPDVGSPGATRVQSSPHSASSASFSNFKTETEAGCEETEEDGEARKKLRLTKEQSTLLEDRFKEHSTLNPKQKVALAKQLNLRPRQVEVWFQNRRARSKLKQTEVDCEFLQRFCEMLTDENRRLQRELQELKTLKRAPATPLFMQLPAATLTVCPACQRVAAGDGGGDKPCDFPSANVAVIRGRT